MKKSDSRRSAGWVRRLVLPVSRHLLWLATCIAAVAVHNLWFDIGKRGVLKAGLDGVFLTVLTMLIVWIHGKLISRQEQCR